MRNDWTTFLFKIWFHVRNLARIFLWNIADIKGFFFKAEQFKWWKGGRLDLIPFGAALGSKSEVYQQQIIKMIRKKSSKDCARTRKDH